MLLEDSSCANNADLCASVSIEDTQMRVYLCFLPLRPQPEEEDAA